MNPMRRVVGFQLSRQHGVAFWCKTIATTGVCTYIFAARILWVCDIILEHRRHLRCAPAPATFIYCESRAPGSGCQHTFMRTHTHELTSWRVCCRRRAVSKKAFSQHIGRTRELKLGAAPPRNRSHFDRFCGLYIFALNRADDCSLLVSLWQWRKKPRVSCAAANLLSAKQTFR